MKKQIKDMREILANETIVSEKIKKFIVKKKGIVEEQAAARDKKREEKITELTDEKDKIYQMKEEATNQTQELTELCE